MPHQEGREEEGGEIGAAAGGGAAFPLRFELPALSERGVDALDPTYVRLAAAPPRRVRRAARGWDLGCDARLLLGIHLHGMAPATSTASRAPTVHWDALFDPHLDLLRPALQHLSLIHI